MTGKVVKKRILEDMKNYRTLCRILLEQFQALKKNSLKTSQNIILQFLKPDLRNIDSKKGILNSNASVQSAFSQISHILQKDRNKLSLISVKGILHSKEICTKTTVDDRLIDIKEQEGILQQNEENLKWTQDKKILFLENVNQIIFRAKVPYIPNFIEIPVGMVNAYMGELFNTEVLGKMAEETERKQQEMRERRVSERENKESDIEKQEATNIFADWGIDEVDDSDLYFSPELGNVVFASAYDGWGFSVHHFANQFSKKLGMNSAVLKKTLWGDYYIISKGGKKRIMKGARDKRKSPLFVSLILENLFKVYETIAITKDKIETENLATSMGIKFPISIAKSSDVRMKLNYVCSQWLPLAAAVLEMVVTHLPSPADMTEERATKLMCSATQRFDLLPPVTQKLREAFIKCSNGDEPPLIIYVSKIFGVERKFLPQDRDGIGIFRVSAAGRVSDAEVEARREEIRRRREETVTCDSNEGRPLTEEEMAEMAQKQKEKAEEAKRKQEEEKNRLEEEVFIAFARVLSGTVRRGQKVYILGPKHDPTKIIPLLDDKGLISEEKIEMCEHIHISEISNIYLLLGRELESLEFAHAGTVVGLSGLESHIIKSATVASLPACPAFTELTQQSTPILRVAVEPHDPRHLPKLRAGLKMLNQADPCVQVILQKSGEYVIVTAGEVHLQRCILDLEERYAKVSIRASDPIVPFRETIIPPPTIDMTNEAILGENINTKKEEDSDPLGFVEVTGRMGTLRCRAIPLPSTVTDILEKHKELLSTLTLILSGTAKNNEIIEEDIENSIVNKGSENSFNMKDLTQSISDRTYLNKETELAIKDLKTKLKYAFTEAGTEWNDAVDRIWSLGPKGCGPNILLNNDTSHSQPSIWEALTAGNSSSDAFYTNFLTGFQMATASGPLCEEPMMGVCFIIETWDLSNVEMDSSVAGQVISLAKDSLRAAFEKQHQRLMCAMYSCNISVTSEVVGRMYSVLGKRHGRIVDGDITEGSTSWNVTAYLPVIESMDFANDLRKSTSGEAMPQLLFSHWEILDVDPYWEPQTTEELTHWGQKHDSENVARKYINAVKKRKGIWVDEKIVEFGEKQRTLSKKI
ncbi:unnamed protein product, partial [Meganyctiphanes norvegica]